MKKVIFIFTMLYFVAGFWLAWEVYHLIKSKNYTDFIFDLTF